MASPAPICQWVAKLAIRESIETDVRRARARGRYGNGEEDPEALRSYRLTSSFRRAFNRATKMLQPKLLSVYQLSVGGSTCHFEDPGATFIHSVSS